MIFERIFSGTLGFTHTLFAVIAMISGIWVVVSTKGGLRHKQLGYIYVASMLLMLLTAFGIYRLFGRFGVFHGLAIVSFLTLVAGMYPALKRKPNWLAQHYRLMSWSVAGLYAAFVAEVAVRFFPREYFSWIVAIGSFVVIGTSAFLIYGRRKQILRKYKAWEVESSVAGKA